MLSTINLMNDADPVTVITTSWDDGHSLDVRLAELLYRKGITGTFYIPKSARYREVSDAFLTMLAGSFEIGAHSLTHPDLTTLDHAAQWQEIIGSKNYIEDITNEPCNVFCYPSGNYDPQVTSLVKDAGFKGARTTQSFCNGVVLDPYLLRTTLQVCTHSKALTRFTGQPHGIRSIASLLDFNGMTENPPGCYDWKEIACATFDIVRSTGGIWHIWGHSWEIEQCGLWHDLEVVLEYVTSQNVLSVSNGQLLNSNCSYA